MESHTWMDMDYCPNCNRNTIQRFRDSDHERDSSGDGQTCLNCGYYVLGWGNEWNEPSDPQNYPDRFCIEGIHIAAIIVVLIVIIILIT